MNGIDFARLKADNDIVDVIGRYVHLTKRGSEYYGNCPFHDDNKASLQVNPRKQIFKCFPCGAGGDVIDFLTKYGKTVQEAVAILSGNSELDGAPEKRKAKKPTRVAWKAIIPQLPATDFTHYRHGQPSRVWAYHTPGGGIHGYVCRFDTEHGKDVLPYSYCTDGTRYEWRWQGLERPRPLYNLHNLIAHPDRTVIVVEGEKTADALAALVEPFGKATITTWIGGANGIHNTDWSPLNGRKVLLWPDNDYSHRYGDKHATPHALKPFEEQPGNKAMLEIAGLFTPSLLKFVRNPDGKPCGWDVADEAEWTGDHTRKYIAANMFDTLQAVADWHALYEADNRPPEPPTPTLPPPPSELPPPPPPPFIPPADEDNELVGENPHFRFLGFENEGGKPIHCFYPTGNRIVVRLSTSAMTKANLLNIAPLTFWEHNFPSKKAAVNVEAAINWLVSRSHERGVFSDKNIRGRGAWHDEGRIVYHAGDHLIVDGQRVTLSRHATRYVYENSERLELDVAATPLSSKEANELVELLRMANWEREINAYLLAGWIVIAPFCGALRWRPHIWITGGAGTGKTTILSGIMRPLLGRTALSVQGETSEAGVRQSLRQDAFPVVFDEIESEDKRGVERVQNILNLMRIASAEDGGEIKKGSAGGNAVSYRIRSCFAFSSIGIGVSQQSDRSRVTILGLRASDRINGREKWEVMKAKIISLITDEYGERFRARSMKLLPVILKNAEIFARAGAIVFGNQRIADQLAYPIAGVYSLHSDKHVELAIAIEWLSQRIGQFEEERGLDSTRDEVRLFEHLMEQIVRVDINGGKMRQVGELCQSAATPMQTDMEITQDLAIATIRRMGIKVDTEYKDSERYIYIASDHDAIKRMLKETAWSKNYHKILLRLDGAFEKSSTTFATGVKKRAIAIPLSLLQP